MDKHHICEHIGKTVLASDAYWGSYIGKLTGYFETKFGLRARVEVLVTVEMPSQHAIFHPHRYVTREPYKAGSIENFDACNVLVYKGEVKEGVTLEETLKNIVLIALEVKIGHSVTLSQSEWESAKKDTLNDVYANRFCFFGNVSSDYFVNTMVDILAVSKRISAA